MPADEVLPISQSSTFLRAITVARHREDAMTGGLMSTFAAACSWSGALEPPSRSLRHFPHPFWTCPGTPSGETGQHEDRLVNVSVGGRGLASIVACGLYRTAPVEHRPGKEQSSGTLRRRGADAQVVDDDQRHGAEICEAVLTRTADGGRANNGPLTNPLRNVIL